MKVLMKTVKPETVGLASERLARISRAMRVYVDSGRLPGAVAMVARRGQIAYAECFGWMDIAADKSMRLDTLFPIYSLTKPVISVAAMMLYEGGRFQLYDPVSEFIPEFKDMRVYVASTDAGMEVTDLKREITIHDLFTHTSGLSSGYDGEENPLVDLYDKAVTRPDRPLCEVVQKLAGLPLRHQPGEAWRYGESYEVLARLVELMSGMPVADFLRQRIFEPLRMSETGYCIPDERLERLAKLYGFSDTGAVVEVAEPGLAYTPTLPRGGHGLISTASDYQRFAQMLLNLGELEGARLLGRKTVQWMTRNHLPEELMPIRTSFGFNGHGYGLGFRVLTDSVQFEVMGSEGEYGWYGWGGNYLWIDPAEDLIGLLMMRMEPFSSMRIDQMGCFSIINPFRVLVYQAIVD